MSQLIERGRHRWECWEILHDGEGPRGRRIVVNSIHPLRTPEEAAEAAAEDLHDREARQEGYDCPACAFDGSSQVIEVETEQGPQCFRVRCRVKVEYEATKEKARTP